MGDKSKQSSKQSSKPSYLGLLNAIAVGERGGEALFNAWAGATKNPDVKDLCQTVALREAEHAVSFAKRLDELGYSVLERDDPGLPARVAMAASKKVSDREKFEKLGFNREPKDQDIFSNFFKDMTIDIRTGELLGRYISEERDTGRRLRACYATLPKGATKRRRRRPDQLVADGAELGDLIRAQPVEDRAADLFDMPWRRPAERLRAVGGQAHEQAALVGGGALAPQPAAALHARDGVGQPAGGVVEGDGEVGHADLGLLGLRQRHEDRVVRVGHRCVAEELPVEVLVDRLRRQQEGAPRRLFVVGQPSRPLGHRDSVEHR